MTRLRRWPDCNAVKVLTGLRMLDTTYDRTLTCTRSALHLGQHIDALARLSWSRREDTGELAAVLRRIERARVR